MTPQVHRPDDQADQLKDSFDSNGYLLIEDFYTAAECDQLKKRMHELIDDFDPSEQRTIFATDDQKHAADDYFRTSGDKIRFFMEKDAFGSDGELVADKHSCINKVGHALHDLDPTFERFSRKQELAKLTKDLGMAEPLLIQSMYIFKPPRIGGEVHCHQDSTFLYTEPESCIGLWIAIEDATIENGCLWAAPGGHKAPLRDRFGYDDDGNLGMTSLDDTPMPEADVPLEAKQGSLVVLHGRLPHQSGHNTSDKSREAYAVHVIDGATSYPESNWLKRAAEMPARGF